MSPMVAARVRELGIYEETIANRRIDRMKDYQSSLEHLHKEAAETRLIADLATDKAKRSPN